MLEQSPKESITGILHVVTLSPKESITGILHVVTKSERKYHWYTTCWNKVQKKVSLVYYML